jgi:hypothetical protein
VYRSLPFVGTFISLIGPGVRWTDDQTPFCDRLGRLELLLLGRALVALIGLVELILVLHFCPR